MQGGGKKVAEGVRGEHVEHLEQGGEMAQFGKTSRERLATAVPELQFIFHEAIPLFDHSILCGHRGQEEQHEAYVQGYSNVDWPNGKHNFLPSHAVDAAPWYKTAPHIRWPAFSKRKEDWTTADWNVLRDWYAFAYFVLGVAEGHGIPLRWGGRWDGQLDSFAPQKFNDFPHFELRD